MKEWYYNEFKQVGVDFTSEEEVRAYDEKYKSVRNLDDEAGFIAQSIKLNAESVILELGTGTGELATRLAKKCAKVVACDVSKPMLKYAAIKAHNLNIGNIEFINAGFINNSFQPETFDAVISQLALHHLPDFWKFVAIFNISKWLKKDGIFFLLDSMFSFSPESFDNSISGVIEFARSKMGNKIADEIIINIRDEYPTYDWIIENHLINNGFRIANKIKYTDIMSLFISEKV